MPVTQITAVHSNPASLPKYTVALQVSYKQPTNPVTTDTASLSAQQKPAAQDTQWPVPTLPPVRKTTLTPQASNNQLTNTAVTANAQNTNQRSSQLHSCRLVPIPPPTP